MTVTGGRPAPGGQEPGTGGEEPGTGGGSHGTGVRTEARQWWPGLISGASDVDPTTVATIAVVGSTTVYGLSWLTLLVFPMLAIVQAISTHLGVVTHDDLQRCARRHFGRPARLVLLVSVVAVATVTVGADLSGGAAALSILFGTGPSLLVVPVAIVAVVLITTGSYQRLEGFLRVAVLSLFAYVVALFLVHVDWAAVLRSTVIPTMRWNNDWTSGALALIGTTLTSYVFVWQTIEDREDAPDLEVLPRRRRGATAGMAVGVLSFWSILIVTGATLGTHHRRVETAEQAAQALRPVAGSAATTLFAIGLLASALVALPVIMATCGVMVGSEFGFGTGLSKSFREVPRFHAVVVAVAAIGCGIALSGVSPIRLLFVSGILAGFGTPVALIALLVAASNGRVMHHHPISMPLRVGGWAVTTVVTAACGLFVAQQVHLF
ncbi:MAG: NRAMP family divalent metal transporter [Acidimicrobiales bacterium]